MTHPLLEGPIITAGQLQQRFGPCVGAVMGYGEGEVGEDGRLQWCAAVLPRTGMQSFLIQRTLKEKAAGRNPRRPFLLVMGSLKRAVERGGVGEAVFGVALAAPENMLDIDLLHPHHLARPENLKADGRFRWPTGVPLLRVWLCQPPVPFATIVGAGHRKFNNSDGNRVIPLDELVPGLAAGIAAVRLQEAALDRPKPLSPYLTKLDAKWREGRLRYSTYKDPVRNSALVDAALRENVNRYGTYHCEECGYEPANDPKVMKDARGMLDVHHLVGIAEGERETTLADVLVLCPTCHRREHLQAGSSPGR